MAEDKASKKHPASAKKKQDLKKKGTVPKSQDVPMALGLIAAFGAMLAMKGPYMARFQDLMPRYISAIRPIGTTNTDNGDLIRGLLMDVLVDVAFFSLPVLLAVMMMAVVANVAQTGLIITGEQLKPNLNKLNPITKIKQWFSIKSLQDLGKSLAKIVVASFLGYLVFKSSIDAMIGSVAIDVTSSCTGQECAVALMVLAASVIKKLFIYIIILYTVIAIVDFAFQRRNFNNEHKMTDKEVKDEYKNSEGDPYQKGKRRQMAQQIAMQSSQEHVPQGDVMVVNPTELAIVLKYDADVSPVPWVLAMGERTDADDMRAAARGAGVPIVRNKPLARALWDLCEVGDVVPEELYRPVAEILAYVFQLKEQLLADANDAAATAAAQSSAAAASAQRLVPGNDGVHDLGAVAVQIDPSAVAARAATDEAIGAQVRSAVASGAVLGSDGSADARFTWS